MGPQARQEDALDLGAWPAGAGAHDAQVHAAAARGLHEAGQAVLEILRRQPVGVKLGASKFGSGEVILAELHRPGSVAPIDDQRIERAVAVIVAPLELRIVVRGQQAVLTAVRAIGDVERRASAETVRHRIHEIPPSVGVCRGRVGGLDQLATRGREFALDGVRHSISRKSECGRRAYPDDTPL